MNPFLWVAVAFALIGVLLVIAPRVERFLHRNEPRRGGYLLDRKDRRV